MKRVALLAACAIGLSASVASAGFQTTTISFSDFSFPTTWQDGVALTSAYQPVDGLTITWDNVAAWGRQSWDGVDHTSGAANGVDISDPTMGSQAALNATHVYSMSFDQPVKIPSLWLAIRNGQNNVVLTGYTNVGDADPAVTLPLPFGSFPGSGWLHDSSTYGASWMQVTGLADTPITKLQFSVTNTGWDNNNLGVIADDITVAAVPEPALAGLVGLGGLAGLARRRRD